MYDMGGAALLLLLMMLDPLKPDVTTTACVDKYFTAYHAPCLIDRAARVFVVLRSSDHQRNFLSDLYSHL